jgi:hypothetical protein
MSALGPKATDAYLEVCFGAKADIAPLFDHFVGSAEQRHRNAQAKGPGGFDIDDHFDFHDCCTGKSAGFSPLRILPV